MTENLPVPLDDTAPLPHQLLATMIAELDDNRQALRRAGDMDSLAAGLVALDTIKKGLATLERSTRQDVTDLMGEHGNKTLQVGDHTVEASRIPASYHWESDELLRLVIATAVAESYPNDDHALDVAGTILDALRDVLPLTNTGISWRMGTSTTPGLTNWITRHKINEHRTENRPATKTVRVK